jgi:hypothetical protein
MVRSRFHGTEEELRKWASRKRRKRNSVTVLELNSSYDEVQSSNFKPLDLGKLFQLFEVHSSIEVTTFLNFNTTDMLNQKSVCFVENVYRKRVRRFAPLAPPFVVPSLISRPAVRYAHCTPCCHFSCPIPDSNSALLLSSLCAPWPTQRHHVNPIFSV